jgi:hypothetical protein
MLFIVIGLIFITAGITAIYFASQMKPEKLVRPAVKKDATDVTDDPFRGGEVKLGEFVKENLARKVFTYAGILLLLVGAGFIYKSVILHVPADGVAARYIINQENASVKLVPEYGPGWHLTSPNKVYVIKQITNVYNSTSNCEEDIYAAIEKSSSESKEVCRIRLKVQDSLTNLELEKKNLRIHKLKFLLTGVRTGSITRKDLIKPGTKTVRVKVGDQIDESIKISDMLEALEIDQLKE